jgi:hypothetical protein
MALVANKDKCRLNSHRMPGESDYTGVPPGTSFG